MARPLRIEYPDALYHVVSRGNARQRIFFDDKDRRIFLNMIENAVQTHHLLCHAYCLMNNHFHLLLETPEANLSRIMRDIVGNFTQKFNKRHKRAGHLFQGRYKAFIIEKESYLLDVARYVVLNPVRAGMANHPREWRWSSYRATAGMIKAPKWLQTHWILRWFSKNHKKAQQHYRQFIIAGIKSDSPFKNAEGGVVLGDQQFVDWVWEKTNGSEGIKEISRSERIVGRKTLEEIFNNILNRKERDLAIIFARKRCGYLNTEIAFFLGIDHSTVGKIVKGAYNNSQ